MGKSKNHLPQVISCNWVCINNINFPLSETCEDFLKKKKDVEYACNVTGDHRSNYIATSRIRSLDAT